MVWGRSCLRGRVFSKVRESAFGIMVWSWVGWWGLNFTRADLALSYCLRSLPNLSTATLLNCKNPFGFGLIIFIISHQKRESLIETPLLRIFSLRANYLPKQTFAWCFTDEREFGCKFNDKNLASFTLLPWCEGLENYFEKSIKAYLRGWIVT